MSRWRPVVLTLAAALLLASPRVANAHDIPNAVVVLVFVKSEPGRLRILVRAPLEAMRDFEWPARGPGYLDLARADPLARQAAQLWIADYIQVYANGDELPGPRMLATRISLPADRAFASYDSALASTLGPPLPTDTDVPWTQTSLDVALEYPVSAADPNIAFRPLLARLGVNTTTVLRFIAADGTERAYQYHGDPGLVRLDPRWFHAAWQFVKLGVHHILIGIDHLLFVFCLVIPFRRFKPLVLIVTAFTVAHSITLASAALGIVPDALWFPPLVETLIAASILYMALENILGARLQRRWLIAFGFGLIHGFGFSFALGETLQFAGSHLALSLLSFNVGVELGQILVLALAIPLLNWAFKRVSERVGVIVLSVFVAHTAWHWMTERGGSLGEYSYSLPAFDLAFAASAMRAAIVLVISAGAVWGLAEVYKWAAGSWPLADGQRPTSEIQPPTANSQ